MTELINWEKINSTIKTKKVVTLPDIFLDHLIFIEDTPDGLFKSMKAVLNGKARNLLSKQKIILGGNAYNTAITISNLGITTYFLGKGDKLIKALTEIQPSPHLINIIEETNSANITTSFEVGKDLNKKNIMLSNIPALSEFTVESIRDEQRRIIADCDAIVVSNWGMTPKGTKIIQYLSKFKKGSQILCIDPADVFIKKNELSDLIEALKNVDYLSINEHEYLALNQVLREETTISELLELKSTPLAKELDNVHLIIHTADHVFGHSPSGNWKVPTFSINPKFTTGLGDTFLGGFLLGILTEQSEKGSGLIGAASAGYYGIEGIHPSLDQLKEFINNTPLKDI